MWMAEKFLAAERVTSGQQWENQHGENLFHLLEASDALKVAVQMVTDGARCERDRDGTCYDRCCEVCRPQWFYAYRFVDGSGIVLLEAYWDYVTPAGRTAGVASDDGHAGYAAVYVSFPGERW